MKFNRIYYYILLFFSFFNTINPHGFAGNTVVYDESDTCWHIENLVEFLNTGQKVYASSYDTDDKQLISKKIKAGGISNVICYNHITFNNQNHSLKCTPLQSLYRLEDESWVPAYLLNVGDTLLCSENKSVQIKTITLIHEPLTVYTLEIKDTHTFLVGAQKIVAHNILVPLSALIGIALPFDIGCGAAAGISFGPIGICGGVIIGSMIGLVTHFCTREKVAQYDITFNLNDITTPTDSPKQLPAIKTIDDILKDTIPGNKTKGKTKQYIKPGSYDDAIKDFDSLRPSDVKKLEDKEGKRGILSDGRDVNIRIESTEGNPTLEIYNRKNKSSIKIRYTNERK